MKQSERNARPLPASFTFLYNGAPIRPPTGRPLMARTAAFRSFARLMTAALLADRRHCSAAEALGAIQESASIQTPHSMSRRHFLLRAGTTGASLALGVMTGFPLRPADAKPFSSALSVGIVGAGL